MAGADVERVAALLREAADLHHRYYRLTDGADEDWAAFYSDWLVGHSELGQILGRAPSRSQLTALLVQVSREDSEDWAAAYAQRIVQMMGR